MIRMPFMLIKGHFVPAAGRPDGDSVRFRANNASYSIEKGAIEPLSSEANNCMEITTNPEPEGHILSRMTGPDGRPIAFIFTDGSEIFLDPDMVRNSVNYKIMKAGYGYPMYYNTLFQNLREIFNEALHYAKQSNVGYWSSDATMTGVTVSDTASLFTINPIWPKLWHRIEEYLLTHNDLDDFIMWLEDKGERVDILDNMEEKGLENVVKVQRNLVRLDEEPENLRVISVVGPRFYHTSFRHKHIHTDI